ncbi:MAG TPA: hypothetical protein VFC19_52220 [Candidatus Limnocylindrales bacterium]|nr:hypothetical protein [Candidatus Limnocylindrales bacterium]
MTARATLIVVERSHRGTLEQQYAHVLWLVRSLRRQASATLLLRGAAAVYAVDHAAPEPLRLAGRAWGIAPDYRETLQQLTEDGAEVLVFADSLAALGFCRQPLVPGVRPVTEQDIVAAWPKYDRIWFL